MSKTYETGHAKNLANFETMLSIVSAYGTAYQPTNPLIQLANLQTIIAQAKTAMSELNTASANYGNAVASRELAFAPLKKLGTRILNALKASATPKPVIENLETFNRKLQGKRASAKITEEEKLALRAAGKEVNQISVAQLSFNGILDNLEKEVSLLATIPQYQPNEPELQVANLQTLLVILKAQNDAVVNAATVLANKRLERNRVMYHPETGLIAAAGNIKNYVKSVYGITAPQFKQISPITFRTIAV